MQYGMIGWFVPLERFPDTYNGQPLGLAGIASQKQYMSLYLNTVYGDPETDRWFRERYAATRKEARHGQVVCALPPTRRPAARSDRRDDRPGARRSIRRAVPRRPRVIAQESGQRKLISEATGSWTGRITSLGTPTSRLPEGRVRGSTR